MSVRCSIWRWLVLAVALVLFLCSLLVLCSAPTTTLWITAILIGEWGHYAVLIGLSLIALSWRGGRLGLISGILASIATALCLWPALSAMTIARTLPGRCQTAFGEATTPGNERPPFSFLNLFRGVPTNGVNVSEHVYAIDGKKQLKLDLYQTNETNNAQPLVLMIHGGSWNGGNKRQLIALNRALARQGYSVVSPNYRHAPEFPYPAAVDDVYRALDFLKTNAAQFHLDVTRIVLIGRSAGGQIALSAAYANKEPGIRGVVGFYAPADLVLGYEVPSRRWVLDSKKVLEDYLGGSPNERLQTYALASPINWANENAPPTLLIHGQLDPIVWPMQSQRLAARLRKNSRPHLYLSLPWATHGCDANLNGPSGQLSFYAIEHFLAAVFAIPEATKSASIP